MTTDAGTPRTKIVADRLDALSLAVAEGRRDEFTMRIPAEPDRDADLVLSEAARMVRSLNAAEAERDALRARVAGLEVGLHNVLQWESHRMGAVSAGTLRALLAPSSEETK